MVTWRVQFPTTYHLNIEYYLVGTVVHAVIQFLNTEIHCQLVDDFGEDGMSLQSIAKWYVEFQGRKANREDYESSGRSTLARTANTVFVKNVIHNNRRTMVSVLQHDLNLSHGTLIKTIQDSGFNKMCVRWVPQTLNNEWLVLVFLPVVKNSFGTLSQKTQHGFITIH
jgi:hypothetical protein